VKSTPAAKDCGYCKGFGHSNYDDLNLISRFFAAEKRGEIFQTFNLASRELDYNVSFLEACECGRAAIGNTSQPNALHVVPEIRDGS